MRTDLTIGLDDDFEYVIFEDSDVSVVPDIDDKIQVGAYRYKVTDRMFQYHKLENGNICDCWIKVVRL